MLKKVCGVVAARPQGSGEEQLRQIMVMRGLILATYKFDAHGYRARVQNQIISHMKKNPDVDFSQMFMADGHKDSLLMEVAREQDVPFFKRLCDEAGLDPFVTQEGQPALLHFAVIEGLNRIVAVLMEMIAEKHIPLAHFKYAADGANPGHLAAVYSPEMMDLLEPFMTMPNDEGFLPRDFVALMAKRRWPDRVSDLVRFACDVRFPRAYLMGWVMLDHADVDLDTNVELAMRRHYFLPKLHEFVRACARGGDEALESLVEVRMVDPVCGHGLFAKRAIPVGSVMAVFNGEVLTRDGDDTFWAFNDSEPILRERAYANGYTPLMLDYGFSQMPIADRINYIRIPMRDRMQAGFGFVTNDGMPNVMKISTGLCSFLITMLPIAAGEELCWHYGVHPVRFSDHYVVSDQSLRRAQAFVRDMDYRKILADYKRVYHAGMSQQPTYLPFDDVMSVYAQFLQMQHIIETPEMIARLGREGIDMSWVMAVLDVPDYIHFTTVSPMFRLRYSMMGLPH